MIKFLSIGNIYFIYLERAFLGLFEHWFSLIMYPFLVSPIGKCKQNKANSFQVRTFWVSSDSVFSMSVHFHQHHCTVKGAGDGHFSERVFHSWFWYFLSELLTLILYVLTQAISWFYQKMSSGYCQATTTLHINEMVFEYLVDWKFQKLKFFDYPTGNNMLSHVQAITVILSLPPGQQ
jgi:hypothetical protein